MAKIQKQHREERANIRRVKKVCKKCPNGDCKWPIQKVDGCKHMVCKLSYSLHLILHMKFQEPLPRSMSHTIFEQFDRSESIRQGLHVHTDGQSSILREYLCALLS